jgi:hypothetical protein
MNPEWRLFTFVWRSLRGHVRETDRQPLTILLLHDVRTEVWPGRTGGRHLDDGDLRRHHPNLLGHVLLLTFAPRSIRSVEPSDLLAKLRLSFVPLSEYIDVVNVLCIHGEHHLGIMSIPPVIKLLQHLTDGLLVSRCLRSGGNRPEQEQASEQDSRAHPSEPSINAIFEANF